MTTNTKIIPYTLTWKNRVDEVARDQWNRLADLMDTPILEWDWLNLLERSGSISAQTGWRPRHLTVWSGHRLVAAAPLYIKSHSAGEFVFDQAWAQVAQRLQAPYYPKLVGMSPVTPTVGYRFLMDPETDETALTSVMLDEIDRFSRQHGIAGCSFLFVDPRWNEQIFAVPYIRWLHQSYLWENPGYASFDEYLANFNANQRRNIRRERQSAAHQGIDLRVHTGGRIDPDLFRTMYCFYQRTNDKFGIWGCDYLNHAFFEMLFRRYRQRLLIVTAHENGSSEEPVGMSLFLRKGKTLIGRYWGSSRDIHALHFNACYYTPIEWAIQNSIRWFDPGAGSPHKIRRGFRAVANYSLHRFTDPRLQWIMNAHIDEINAMERARIDALNEALPFVRCVSMTTTPPPDSSSKKIHSPGNKP